VISGRKYVLRSESCTGLLLNFAHNTLPMSLIFTVEDTFATDDGIVAVGYAPHPDIPLPKKGDLVEVDNPDGSNFRVKIADVDIKFSNRSCCSQKTVNRAVKFISTERIRIMVRAEIRSCEEAQT